MQSFFAELKRRHIYRVAAAYTVVAWVLIQLVSNVSPMLRLPDWAGTFVLVLLFVGFPVALLFAWIHQLAPESGALAHVTTGKLDWFLAGALVVMIALVSYQQLAPSPGAISAQQEQAGVAGARSAAASPKGMISLAVLPFANMSGDANQEFFSDGMTEEITSALAKIPDLRVVARTSAFQFKGEKKDMRAVGQALGATHLIEGSVRKEGNRVRITAQLIEADNGVHVWTESYDRELTGVFTIQEDIATAIAGALRMPLGLKPGQNLVNNRSIDPESHEQFLRALGLVSKRGLANITQASQLTEQVLARNPDYAPAWPLLSGTLYQLVTVRAGSSTGSVTELRKVVDEFRSKAEAAAQRAIALDPGLSVAHMMVGVWLRARGQQLEAEEAMLKGLAIDADDYYVLSALSNSLAMVGRLKESLAMIQKVQAIEPFAPAYRLDGATMLWLTGQNEAAIDLAKTLPPGFRGERLAMIYASLGRFAEAAEELDKVSDDANGPDAQAARLLRSLPKSGTPPGKRAQQLPTLPQNLEFVYLYAGAPERVLDSFDRRAEIGFYPGLPLAFRWHPSFAPVRKTERFKTYLRKSGFLEYWRAKGWPEFCHPVGADDFTCE